MPLSHGKSKKSFEKNIKTEMESGKSQPQSLAIAYSVQRQAKRKKMADGGMVMSEAHPSPAPEMDTEEHYESIADAILKKSRKSKMMAEGGMVDIQHNGDEMPNYYDELNEDAIKKELYDDSQMGPEPMDSNEMGDSEEDMSENKHDMVSKIMKKRKK